MQTRFFLDIARCFSASDVTSNKVRACGCGLRHLSSLGENFGIDMFFMKCRMKYLLKVYRFYKRRKKKSVSEISGLVLF